MGVLENGSLQNGDEGVAVNYVSAAQSLKGYLFGGRPRILVICAEPGMGAVDLVEELIQNARGLGWAEVRRSYRGLDQEHAARNLVAFSREVSTADEQRFCVVEGLPPSDEVVVGRQARALARMAASGSPVVVSILPEARQLAEELDGCICVSSGDVLVKEVALADPGSEFFGLCGLTRGMPSLLKALVSERGELLQQGETPMLYYDALAELTSEALRSGLTDEEAQLRLVMLLMGSGSSKDLEYILGPVSQELLVRLHHDAPLFGVSNSCEEFCCLEADYAAPLSICYARVEDRCRMFSHAALGCARYLCGLGEYARAAFILGMPCMSEGLDLVLEYAVELLDIGEARLVSRALERRGRFFGEGEAAVRASALSLALAALGKKGLDAHADQLRSDISQVRGQAAASLLFVGARLILRGEPLGDLGAVLAAGDCERGASRRLAVHASASALLLSGRFSDALSLVASCSEATGAQSASAALLGTDLELARVLVGDLKPGDDGGLADAMRSRVCIEGLCGLEGYASCLELVGVVLYGGEGAAELADQAIAASERLGDALVQTIALLVGAVLDLRGRAIARANVRSLLARSIARRCGQSYLERLAKLLGSVVRFVSGETSAVENAGALGPEDDLARVTYLVNDITLSGIPLVARVDLDEVPRDALWVLGVLTNGLGEFSLLLRERIPLTWQRAIEATGKGWCEGPKLRLVVDGGGAPIEVLEPKRAPVRVRLLGGFQMSVQGTPLTDELLERRNIKSIMEYLLLCHNGEARRFQLVEQIWPESDYKTGHMKAYKSTGELRAAIRKIDPTVELFLTNRNGQRIALNMKLIDCDVKEFELCAREAVESQDEVQALSMAQRAEAIYRGDLYQPAMDATGYVTATARKLRREYVDAMVAGGDAALRLGQKRTAARFASNALGVDELREDAVRILVDALRASGRSFEADQQARNYEQRLSEKGVRLLRNPLREVSGEQLPLLWAYAGA